MDILPEEVFTYKVHLQLNVSSTLPAHCAKYAFQTNLELIDHMNIGSFTIGSIFIKTKEIPYINRLGW